MLVFVFIFCPTSHFLESRLLRASICSFDLSFGDTSIDSFPNYLTPDQYLSTSGFEIDRTFGSETEVFAFSFLPKVDMYV